jgi:hypothetical protein
LLGLAAVERKHCGPATAGFRTAGQSLRLPKPTRGRAGGRRNHGVVTLGLPQSDLTAKSA